MTIINNENNIMVTADASSVPLSMIQEWKAMAEEIKCLADLIKQGGPSVVSVAAPSTFKRYASQEMKRASASQTW
ncbi:hypothetical protein INT48_006752 [Thamnidium elegans]|uniref:Uncharacterized protein n=1 Tax=Thamnidium elegans TaxID=101142 RepID=A0A8H7SRC5_9FUNG|nr:hypothetical protein INT48_006752 [Thamnidium elegans]